MIATVRSGSAKTNPNIRTLGVDENYLKLTDTKLDAGRNFSNYELYSGAYVCILGNGAAQKLCAHLSETDRAAIFGGTATRFYRL